MSDIGKTVGEWIESAIQSHNTCEYDEQIRTYRDLKIVREFDGTAYAFPQTRYSYRNVYNWVLLEDGTAVGWNESPRVGFSFPRSGKVITQKYLYAFLTKEN
jgi:hypothetical protein